MSSTLNAFTQAFSAAVGHGSRGYLSGVMSQHQKRMQEAASTRAERQLDINEDASRRAELQFPGQLKDAGIRREAVEFQLGELKAGSAASKQKRKGMQAAANELEQMMLATEGKLTQADVAEIALKHDVSPVEMQEYLGGGAVAEGPQFRQLSAGTAYGTEQEGVFTQQGRVPLRGPTPRNPNERMTALTQLLKVLQPDSTSGQGGQMAMMMDMLARRSGGQGSAFQGLLSRDQQNANPELAALVGQELQSLFTPELQYDVDPASGSGILFNPATKDTLFGGQ